MPGSLNFKRDHCCDADQLGYEKYILIFADMIRARDFDTPFCIGIYGKWGSGKTSFMRLLERELAKEEETANAGQAEKGPCPVPVWFNPWRYEKEEHLIIPFLKTIEQALKKYGEKPPTAGIAGIKEKLLDAGENVAQAARAVAYGTQFNFLGLTLTGSDMIDRETELKDEQKADITRYVDTIPSIYYDISNHLKKAVGLADFRIIVFIDDLDRCMPEKAVELLESIKLFLDLEGYLFVLGVDKDVVEQGIRHHYKFYEDEYQDAEKPQRRIISPDDYLDKMIQMPFDLPPMEPTRKQGFIEALLGGSAFREHSGMVQAGIEDNPRTLTRFVNFLAFMGRLAETLKNSILEEDYTEGRPDNYQELLETYFQPFFYLKWSIIVFGFSREYQEIKNRTVHLSKLQQSARGTKTDADKEKAETPKVHVPERLKEVLRMGKPFTDDPWLIRKFVYLTDSVSVRVREEPDAKSGLPERLPEIGSMVTVPKGPFQFGDTKKTRSIDADYELDTYPVTNKQYKEFIAANGYATNEFWSEAGWAWLQEEKVTEPQFWQDKEWNTPNQPVVGVSYYEAEAYAKWAGKRLPTEEEWEKAARGDNGLEYPWGNEFEPEKCNTSESGLKKSTPVTQYPSGQSPYGCLDMAGNVWEWTGSFYDNDKSDYVLRGGSWFYNRNFARCANRFRYYPYFGISYVGFRCARTIE